MLSSTPSPNEHNTLIELILHEFVGKFVPSGRLLYLYNVDEKLTRLDKEGLQELGIILELHKDAPDIIFYDKARNWLILIDVVPNRGPITSLRHEELKKMFGKFDIGLVFVTAFRNYKEFQEALDDISWETEVWVAESPSHLIHFDGERFLGPY